MNGMIWQELARIVAASTPRDEMPAKDEKSARGSQRERFQEVSRGEDGRHRKA